MHDQIITAGSELQRLLWLRQDDNNWTQLGWRRLGGGSPQILAQRRVNGSNCSPRKLKLIGTGRKEVRGSACEATR